MSRLKLFIATFFGISVLALSITPGIVSAASDTQNALCAGSTLNLEENDNTKCTKSTDGVENKANKLIEDIVNLFSIIVGIVAVIMIIYGGFRYVTSGGDAANITAAKNVVLYAIIGLVIAALAQVIVKFILVKTTES